VGRGSGFAKPSSVAPGGSEEKDGGERDGGYERLHADPLKVAFPTWLASEGARREARIACVFASSIAARSVHSLAVTVSHVPSPALASAASPVELTVNVL
jgi:hypothetical protein